MLGVNKGILEWSWQVCEGRLGHEGWEPKCYMNKRNRTNKRKKESWQPKFSKAAEELERRTGHISTHSIMCHPLTGINLLALACPAFPLQLHLTASLHEYWASLLAEYSTNIKDTWPLSHAKTLSAILHHNEGGKDWKRGNYKEGKKESERLNTMFGSVRQRDSKWRNWGSEAMEGVGGGVLQ